MGKGKQLLATGGCGNSSKDKGEASKNACIDCSRVKVLLWDIDDESREEVTTLLMAYSYQVIPARSTMEVVDVLKSEGTSIDIVLVEAGLVIGRDKDILECVIRDKNLQHISVILLLTQDRLSLLHKGLKLGAADYLVKPLSAKEILSLWRHVKRNASF